MVILCLLPSNSYADLVYSPNGRLGYVVSERTNGITTIKEIGGGYHQVDTSTHNIRSAVSGARSNAPVPATVSRTVPAAKVAQNVLGKLKAARFTPQGLIGGLILEEILNKLLEEGYTYDESAGTMVLSGRQVCISATTGNCFNNSDRYVSVLSANLGSDKIPLVLDRLCKEYGTSHFELPPGVRFTSEMRYSSAGFCVASTSNGGTRAAFISYGDNYQQLVSDVQIQRILEPIAAEKPAEVIAAAELSDTDWSAPKVHVLDGTVAQSYPYTDPQDGKAKQATWQFYDCADGTCVKETLTDRPDLLPNSPEAPAPQTPPGTGTGTGTGSATGTGSGNQTGSETPPPFDLCKEHPEILACQQMGQPDPGQFDDIKIPVRVDDTTWQEDIFLPSTGVCPAPKTFNFMGKPLQVSYQPLCSLAEQIRFAVLICFILSAAYVCFGGLKQG